MPGGFLRLQDSHTNAALSTTGQQNVEATIPTRGVGGCGWCLGKSLKPELFGGYLPDSFLVDFLGSILVKLVAYLISSPLVRTKNSNVNVPVTVRALVWV